MVGTCCERSDCCCLLTGLTQISGGFDGATAAEGHLYNLLLIQC